MVVKIRLTACSTVNDPRAGLRFLSSENISILKIVLTVQGKRLEQGEIGHTGESISTVCGSKVDQTCKKHTLLTWWNHQSDIESCIL